MGRREGWIKKGHEETFGGDKNISFLDRGDGFTSTCIFLNGSNVEF